MPERVDASTRVLLVCAAPVVEYEALVESQALESDFVIAVDGGARLCRQASVTPDLVVGDLDSVDSATLTSLAAAGISFAEHPADKDETDLDLAVAEARNHGATDIVVCAAFSGRLDHTLAAIGTLRAACDLRPEIAEAGQHGWVLSSSHRPRLDTGPPNATISILALTDGVVVTVQGVRWPLVREPLCLLGSRTVSNFVTHTAAYVQVHAGVALVMMPSVDDAVRQA